MPRKRAQVLIDNDADPGALAVGGAVRVSRLHDLVSVRAEIGRLYREARKREGRYPDALTALRLSTILNAVVTSIELAEHEAQIRELKEQLEQLRGESANEFPRLPAPSARDFAS